MKEHYGNHLGIVISGGDKDPEMRGRCQIFVPHIMPALYESWNQDGQDKSIQIIGTNLENSLTTQQIEKLKKILPWAECAAPIIGAGPSTRVLPTGEASETAGNTGFAVDTRGTIGGLSPVINLNATPVSQVQNSTGDITANTDGSVNIPGVNVVNSIIPGRTYGIQATQNAKPFSNIVIHDPGGPITTQNLINYVQTYDKSREGTFGYTLIIDKNGTVYQAAPWNARTNHVASSDTEATGYNWVQNNNSLGIALMGNSKDYTAAQSQTLQKIIAASGIRNIYGHGEVSRNREPGEGVIAFQMRSLFGDAIANSEQMLQTPPGVTPAGGYNGGVAADGRTGTSTTASVDAESANNAGTGQIPVADNGAVNPNDLNAYLKQRLQNSSLIGKDKVPADGAQFGIVNGTVDEWASFFTKLAEKESGYNVKPPTEAGESDPGGSYGLYQVSKFDGSRYGANPSGKDWSLSDLRDPVKNTDTAVAIFEKNLSENNNIIQTREGEMRGAGYFNITSMDKIVADVSNGQFTTYIATNQQDTQNPARKRNPITNETEAFGSSFGPDTNFQATGMFGYAREGQAVWCFFREGNPLFPVYFAASYGQQEWANIRQAASPGSMEPGFDATVINLQGGGIRSAQTFADLNVSGLGNDTAFELYSKTGHNFRMGTDTVELNSLYNFRQQTEGDHYNITLQNRETRTMGDDNYVIGQDCFITVGNWDTDAQEAASELQKIVNESMQIGDEG